MVKTYFLVSALLASQALAIPASFLIQTSSSSLNDQADAAAAGSLGSTGKDEGSTAAARVKVFFKESVDSIVDQLKDSIESAAEDVIDLIRTSSATDDGDNDGTRARMIGSRFPFPLPPHHPPAEVDFSDYTINQILNASLYHHRHEEHNSEHPASLPLHRLACLVNRSSEAQQSLDKEGITLLAPDDSALTPPHHRRHGQHASRLDRPHRQSAEERAFEEAEMGAFAERSAELIAQPLVHPIYHVQRSLKGFVERQVKEGGGGGGGKDDDDDDQDEEKKRHERFVRILGYILKYHTVPAELTESELASSSTIESGLNTSRIKVEPSLAFFPHLYPTIRFNGYASKKLTVKAKNGLIHLIGAPLLPPLSPLNGLFLFPQEFATLTSDLQKVDLAEALLPHWHSSEETQQPEASESTLLMDQLMDEIVKEKNLTSFTIFAPTNWAFTQLGPKIVALLHSPFPISKRILKYVLSYHVVPGVVFFSDFVQGAEPSKDLDRFIVSEHTDVEVPQGWLGEDSFEYHVATQVSEASDISQDPHPKANVTRYELPTLLSEENKNATLKVLSIAYRHLGKGPILRSIVVLPNHADRHHDDHDHEGHVDFTQWRQDTPYVNSFWEFDEHRDGPSPAKPVRVSKTDLPARNGAVQVVSKLLRPPMPKYDEPSFGKPSTHKKHKFLGRGLANLFD